MNNFKFKSSRESQDQLGEYLFFGSIQVYTNKQDNDEDLIDDIVHETAHAVERMFPEYIFDTALQDEFLSRRQTLFNRLKREQESVKLSQFLNLQYAEGFDEFLYKKVGYPRLAILTHDLFNSPYSATSLQEYWASAFEEYFIGKDGPRIIKAVSPVLYDKIVTLTDQHS